MNDSLQGHFKWRPKTKFFKNPLDTTSAAGIPFVPKKSKRDVGPREERETKN
jgi:hypothetical protein